MPDSKNVTVKLEKKQYRLKCFIPRWSRILKLENLQYVLYHRNVSSKDKMENTVILTHCKVPMKNERYVSHQNLFVLFLHCCEAKLSITRTIHVWARIQLLLSFRDSTSRRKWTKFSVREAKSLFLRHRCNISLGLWPAYYIICCIGSSTCQEIMVNLEWDIQTEW